MNNKFLKQKPIIVLLLILRVIVMIACISLIGTRFIFDVYINTPKNMLIEATKAGDVHIVTELLRQGAMIDFVDVADREFTTPLFLSTINIPLGNQYVEIDKILIRFYTKMNAQNWRGESALHAITMIENFDTLLDTFNVLFLNGGNIDLKDKEGNTMLEEFVRSNYRGAVDILLKNYADIFGLKRIEGMIKKSQEYMFTDLEEIVDIYQNALKMNRFIPANISTLDEQLRCILRGNFQILDEEPIKRVTDIFGNNQLHYAIRLCNLSLAELLLKKSIELAYVKNKDGSYPLHIICVGDCHIEIQKNLLVLFEKYKVNLNQQDGTGSTIVHILIKKRNFELVRFIVQTFKGKIDLSIRDRIDHETPRELLVRLDKSMLYILD